MRRKYDLEQGAGSKYANFDSFNSNANKEKLAAAQSQDKMLGRKGTEKLIKKGEKMTKTAPDGPFGAFKKIVISGENSKAIEEVTRAKDLLRAGRQRNRAVNYRSLYEPTEVRVNLNDVINAEKGWDKEMLRREYHESKLAAKHAKKAASEASIAKHAAKAKRLKVKKNLGKAGKVALGVGAGAGLAYGGKKIYDHYKNKKKEED